MQFSESWLRILVNPPLDTDQLAHAVTMAGLEVEALIRWRRLSTTWWWPRSCRWKSIPDADRLRLCQVAVGEASRSDRLRRAQCGGRPQGAVRAVRARSCPASKSRSAKVRGVESFGMLCSAKELGLARAATA